MISATSRRTSVAFDFMVSEGEPVLWSNGLSFQSAYYIDIGWEMPSVCTIKKHSRWYLTPTSVNSRYFERLTHGMEVDRCTILLEVAAQCFYCIFGNQRSSCKGLTTTKHMHCIELRLRCGRNEVFECVMGGYCRNTEFPIANPSLAMESRMVWLPTWSWPRIIPSICVIRGLVEE